MRYFLTELKKRNALLYWFGWLNLAGAVVCLLMWQVSDLQVAGVNAYIKPFKFFVSIAIFTWTMGWLLEYLQRPGKVKAYSIMVILVLSFELSVIVWQAVNGRLSHFNTDKPFYLLLFNLMGVAIVILTLWTAYIGFLFFVRRTWHIPMSYVWGIRLGILFFVIFAAEGGMMASALRHTVGAADGGPGLPIVNWSRNYGDLRIAHFFGMHALQVLPLAGYYLIKKPAFMILFALVYISLVALVFVQALNGMPLFGT